MQDTVELSVDFNAGRLCDGLFARRLVEEDRVGSVALVEWATDEKSFLERLTELGQVEIVTTTQAATYQAAVFYIRGSLVYLDLSRQDVVARVAGPPEERQVIVEALKVLLPEAEEISRVKITFWYWSAPNAWARRISRLLQVPTWDQVAVNYPAETREPVGRLINAGVGRDAGQLILWFGEPGCGKTYALRALMAAWRSRMHIHYISDTDNFFGSSDYML